MFIEEVGAAEHINNVDKVRKKAVQRSNEAPPAQPDKLDIAKSSGFQQAIKEIIAQTPDIREEKVRDIEERIADNSYNVPSSAIADKIMTNEEFDGLRRALFG